MMDEAVLAGVVEQLYVSRLAEYYGAVATSALGPLVTCVRAAYRYVPPDCLSSRLVVCSAVYADTPFLDSLGDPLSTDLADMLVHRGEPLVVQVGDDSVRMWKVDTPDIDELTLEAIVYVYEDHDTFRLPGESISVDLGTGYPSVFALPTFFELEALLDSYAKKVARRSSCLILAKCWADNGRLVLANKPESVMRDSLAQYLRTTLREHESIDVRVEQMVDESHPVDIKVQWLLSNRTAMIEVKWIGDSWNPDATDTLKYRGHRANEGAKQLADYLEANLDHSVDTVNIGYLVVFDARRRGLEVPLVPLSDDDASYYKDREIVYNPDYVSLRRDFRDPRRLFMEHRSEY